MESATRQMWKTNDRCILYRGNHLLRHIPMKTREICDIPTIAARTWDSFVEQSIERWRDERGLLVYTEFKKDMVPPADALLFVECPLRYRTVEKIADRIGREIIIYRHPDWSMHEEALDYYFPGSAHYTALLATIAGLHGKELSEKEERALAYSGLDRANVTIFTAQDIENICGIPERQLKALLAYKFRGFYLRWQCYTPLLEPTEAAYWETYKALEALPDVGGGMRMLKMGIGDKGVRALVKECYVSRVPDVYMMRHGWKTPDMDIIDAISNVKRGDFYHIKALVDLAPRYNLSVRS